MTENTLENIPNNVLNNKDYKLVGDAIKVLKIQLEQAEKDLNELIELKEIALKDPINFVENLIDKKYKNIPQLQKVIAIPNIDLSRYQYHSLRDTKNSTSSNYNAIRTLYKDIDYSDTSSSKTTKRSNYSKKRRTMDSIEVDDNRSIYSNEWTDYETNQLAELLKVYPEESVHMSRYIKIANALGTKTPKQIESKVQRSVKRKKSNKKSNKPQKIANESKIKATRTLYSNRFSGAIYLGTPTVFMSEEEGESGLETDQTNSTLAHDELKKVSGQSLKSQQQQQPQQQSPSLPQSSLSAHQQQSPSQVQEDNNIHYGIKCDRCGTDPIVGVRYRCKMCTGNFETDLCEDCINKNFENDHHTLNHTFEKIETFKSDDKTKSSLVEEYPYLVGSRGI